MAALADPMGRRWQVCLGALLLIVVASVTALPVLLVVLGALDGGAWRATFVDETANRTALGYSVFLALRAPIAAVIGFLITWTLIRIRIPGGQLIELALWITFFIPLLPVTLSWILVLGPHRGLLNQLAMMLPFVTAPPFNIYSLSGILFVHIISSSIPVMVVILAPPIRALNASFEEVARVCGARPLTVFRQITLPILAPAILTATLAGFIKSLEAFEVERLLGQPAGIQVYSTRIYDLVSMEPPNFAAAMELSTVVLSVLFLIAIIYQRMSWRFDHVTVLGRGAGHHPLRIGRMKWLISGGLFLLVAISLGFPLLMLVIGSCMKLFGFFAIKQPFTLAHWQEVLGDPLFLNSLRNSLILGAGSGIFGVLIYAGLAQIILRSKLPGRHIIDVLAWLPWSIPGILLGISMLWIILSGPLPAAFYGSFFSLILVMIIAQMPIGVHMIKTSIGQISPDLEQAARVCGAGSVQTFVHIVLPLIRPMLVSIFVIVFIAAMRDISTIIFLATATHQTLSLLMMQFALASNLEASAVVGVITAAIILLVALAARRFGLLLVVQS